MIKTKEIIVAQIIDPGHVEKMGKKNVCIFLYMSENVFIFCTYFAVHIQKRIFKKKKKKKCTCFFVPIFFFPMVILPLESYGKFFQKKKKNVHVFLYLVFFFPMVIFTIRILW